MPSSDLILQGLEYISNNYKTAALVWHVVFLTFIITIFFARFRPSKQKISMFLSIPLFSVSVLAFINNNIFNTIVFLIFGVILFVTAYRMQKEAIKFNNSIYNLIGSFLVLFGLVYPHFLIPRLPIEYLYLSPVSLIPCPTILVIIGFTLIFSGFKNKLWSITLSVLGIFYGLFGVVKLNVYLDIVLLVGSLILLFYAIFNLKRSKL